MHYVLSDIHGNERRFRSILKQIDLKPEDTLYVLGDVIDRHPGGLRILRQLMSMKNVRMLLGNHEYMMLRALGHPLDSNIDDGRALAHWYRNGGDVTHRHWKRLRKSIRAEIIEYLQSLPLNIDIQVGGTDYRLVHAAPESLWAENTDVRYLTQTHFAVWRRLKEWEFPVPGPKLIFGHTPTRNYRDIAPMEIWHGPNAIGIDCGSGYPETGNDSLYGRLACIRLEDGKTYYSMENNGNPL